MIKIHPGMSAPARIEELRVKNFRALHDIEIKNITSFMILLGPNGSGKSTLFDVFNFLSDCFSNGLQQAWNQRGKAKELKTRGSSYPVVIELKYREKPQQPIITYHLNLRKSESCLEMYMVIHKWFVRVISKEYENLSKKERRWVIYGWKDILAIV